MVNPIAGPKENESDLIPNGHHLDPPDFRYRRPSFLCWFTTLDWQRLRCL